MPALLLCAKGESDDRAVDRATWLLLSMQSGSRRGYRFSSKAEHLAAAPTKAAGPVTREEEAI